MVIDLQEVVYVTQKSTDKTENDKQKLLDD